MIATNQFRTGMTIRFEDQIYQIVEFQHVKPGKGGAFVRTKLRNVETGSTVDKTFRPEQKFEHLRTEGRTMTFLYADPESVVLMDNETYDQLTVQKSFLEDKVDLMTENMEVEVVYIDERPFDVELPIFVDLEVAETTPGIRGDTVSGGSKEAVLESGATIQVPLFVEEGDTVRVDTRTRQYSTRV